ncbi:MAG TPA: hypothetical protein VK911_08450 [Vicinamibacterales bacterium]|nr:hypothetical protein [Vicinamibacterales bacterium]
MTISLVTAARRPGLVFLLWAWYTALALVAAVPYRAWLAGITGAAPETDVLLEGVQVGTLVELLQASDSAFPWLPAILAGLVGLALLSNAFLSGGLFQVMVVPGPDRLLPGFFQAAGHFFFRSLGLLAITAALLLVAAAGAAALGALLGAVAGNNEAVGAAAALIVLLLLAGVAAFLLLALDYSRVRLVTGDRIGVVRTWLDGARFVAAHPLRAVTPGVLYGAAIAGTLVLAAWATAARAPHAWAAILAVIVLQQARLLVRVLLRVGLVAAEVNVISRRPA